tara:strand:+ start:87124 stop:90456 length:3333 start_codon:yes stop_codon:yes gene_type:complete
MTDTNDGRAGVDQKRTFLVVCLCFLLSGFAALLYETVWLRQFAIILGTSEQALAVILGAYMGGLSFGAWVASRTAGAIRRPLLTYGVLEAGIAICALAMPLGLSLVQSLQVKFFGGATEPPPAGSLPMVLFGLVSAFALILPPTAMMGATLPLLAKYVVRNDQELGPRIGLLYAINTLGAVVGTLSAAFLCLPALGLGRTTWVGAGVNLAVFALVYLGLKEIPAGHVETSDAGITDADITDATTGEGTGNQLASTRAGKKKSDRREQSGTPVKSSTSVSGTRESGTPVPYESILWFAAISGSISFCYEIVFTRMLGHSLGGSIFAFATMLAGFLLGIALGGGIAARLATDRKRAAILFVYAQALTGVFALVAFWSINVMSAWSLEGLGGNHATLAQVAISIAILLPSATCIGATFPLAIRIFAKDERDASRGSAKVYFWNTIGAIAGSLLTGMFILPVLEYHGATILAILLNGLLAITIVMVMRLPKGHAAAGVVTLACMLMSIPVAPENVLRVSALPGPMTHGDFVFNEVGRSATVTVFQQETGFRFQTNGLPEAAASFRGAGLPFSSDGAWLSALPPLVRPGGETMLVIGLGGGTAASFVPPSVKQFDVFELEPAVVDANRRIRNARQRDPLADPRINVVLNDGRNGLALTTKKYDYIVSQPSHPWTAGASHLYTREFNQIARDHLLPGGIFLQWMDTQFLDLELTRSMAAGLLEVFPHMRIYEPTPGSMMFVSSDQPIEPEMTSENYLRYPREDRAFYRAFGMIKPTDLLSFLKMDEVAVREFSNGAPPITDEFNLLAMRAPHLLSRMKPEAQQVQKDMHRWEPLQYYSDGLESLCPTINYRAMAIRLRARTTIESPKAKDHISDPIDLALLNSSLAQFRGDVEEWESELERAAKLDPDDPRPAYLLLAYSALGSITELDEKRKKDLISRLEGRLAELYKAVELLLMPNNEGVPAIKEYEEVLSKFEPDDIGYGLASRLRIVWRISDMGPESVRLGREALVIAAEAAPSLGSESVAYFETVAAVQANRPHVALSTTMTLANSIVERAKLIDNGEVTVEQVQKMFPNLARCRSVLSDRNAFRSVPSERYRSTILFLDNLLAGYPGPVQ